MRAVTKPVKDGDCFSCHNPHASDHDNLLTQAPETLCFQCHDREEKANQSTSGVFHRAVSGLSHPAPFAHKPTGAACGAPLNSLCASCHEQGQQNLRVSHAPVSDTACDTCHAPHGSTQPSLLVEPQQELCLDCHETMREPLARLNLHAPAATNDCSGCHQPHGSNNRAICLKNGARRCAPPAMKKPKRCVCMARPTARLNRGNAKPAMTHMPVIMPV